MAAGDMVVFEEARAYLIDGGWEAADNIKVALVTNTPTPAAADAVPGMGAGATTQYTEVAAGGSYTAGGELLDTLGNMVTEAGGTVTFDDTGASVSWAKNAASPSDCRWGVIYNDSDSTLKRAIAFVDLGQTIDLKAGDLTITWHASGIFTIS